LAVDPALRPKNLPLARRRESDRFGVMPPQHHRDPEQPTAKSLEDIIADQGLYPIDAFSFVGRGLTYTVEKTHRQLTGPAASRHVSGQQLCEGLREFALAQWGMMARTVLGQWNIHRTEDFGKIVFTLVESGNMSKTAEDNPDDFNGVYDFAAVFDCAYAIDAAAVRKGIETHS
jgi:uncharacterized repeat protein (TIGR04138 family)